jgi:hypothetical protein
VLDADQEVLERPRSVAACVTFTNWPAVHGAENFGAPGDTKVHLGLIPQPFCGNVAGASVYVLLLNPGLDPSDYYAEYEVPAYRNAVLSNLKQDFDDNPLPFLFLDPRFSWHSGFRWWHGKLARVIARLAKEWALPFADARARLATRLASIELFPYHSQSFRDPDPWHERLPSAKLATTYVHEVLMPRVYRGEATVIVTRKVKSWGLPNHPGVATYTSAQSRGAHLTPDSPGGRAILARLTRGSA